MMPHFSQEFIRIKKGCCVIVFVSIHAMCCNSCLNLMLINQNKIIFWYHMTPTAQDTDLLVLIEKAMKVIEEYVNFLTRSNMK